MYNIVCYAGILLTHTVSSQGFINLNLCLARIEKNSLITVRSCRFDRVNEDFGFLKRRKFFPDGNIKDGLIGFFPVRQCMCH